jgi:hypothetical protein
VVDDDKFRRMQSRLADLLPRLNERDRRLALAAEAKSWDRGGISAVHRATGASRSTIRRGITELEGEDQVGSHRVRQPGGGRKKAELTNPELLENLDSLIAPETRGDPESPLRWTTKSTRHLARQLTAMGTAISHSAVAAILRSSGYSLQGTRKMLEGAQHPDRDAQFRYINSLAQRYLDVGDPVISVDTKKRELVGRFTQAGTQWQPVGVPEQVSTYDFPHLAEGKAIPYGVYDLADDSGWVSVGVDHDTSVFAVATIEQWWLQMGLQKYPNAQRLLITADGGGSNGHRPWLWKYELARLAQATGLAPHAGVARSVPGRGDPAVATPAATFDLSRGPIAGRGRPVAQRRGRCLAARARPANRLRAGHVRQFLRDFETKPH